MIIFYLGRKKEGYDLLRVWAEALRFVRCTYKVEKIKEDNSYIKIGESVIQKGSVDDIIYVVSKHLAS